MSTELTLAELAQFKGENDSSVYIAVKGIIYDVTAAREFYGPGGNYHVFAGRECARALASMKIDESYCDDNLEGLDEKSLKILDDWIKKFTDKYPIIGKVKT
eukprot:g6975.t1